MESLERVEIRGMAAHTGHASPVGAYRMFDVVSDEDGMAFRSPTLMTTQMTSYRQRRQVKRWLEECM